MIGVSGGETGGGWIGGEYYGQHPELVLLATVAAVT